MPKPTGPDVLSWPTGVRSSWTKSGSWIWRVRSKLLRVLQERTFEPLGQQQKPHRGRTGDLRHQPDAGGHGSAGYLPAKICTTASTSSPSGCPPCRERPGDVPLLAEFFIKNLKEIYQRPDLRLSPAAAKMAEKPDFAGQYSSAEKHC